MAANVEIMLDQSLTSKFRRLVILLDEGMYTEELLKGVSYKLKCRIYVPPLSLGQEG